MGLSRTVSETARRLSPSPLVTGLKIEQLRTTATPTANLLPEGNGKGTKCRVPGKKTYARRAHFPALGR